MQETLGEQSNCDRATTASCPSNQAKEFRNTAKKRFSTTGLKCRKPVFMQVSGICFTKWLYFGSICGWSNTKMCVEN